MDILSRLRLPEALAIKDLDSPEATEAHGRILQKKEFLKKLYLEFYREFAEAAGSCQGKTVVEIGSGGGFLKSVMPQVKTSDVFPSLQTDLCFSAERMPFEDGSVDMFCMLNVFHHIKDPRAFLSDAARCLKPGGKLVMIEPANTIWARFVYRNFHHEVFDPAGGWGVAGTGPLSSSNSAMPYIIFIRDRKEFEEQFRGLRIRRLAYHTPIAYLVSGGFSLRQLLPGMFFGLVRGIESALSPLGGYLGMFMTIEIEKKDETFRPEEKA